MSVDLDALNAGVQAASRGPAGLRRTGGRPTLQAAELLGDRILDVATQLLLDHGYGATSIEAIVKQAGVSKRTFYHRFADKPTLMAAVVKRLIDRWRPASFEHLMQGTELRTTLSELGALILDAALSPQIVQLHRLMVAEGERFPELAVAVAGVSGRQEAIALIVTLLRRHRADRPLGDRDADFAASQFLQMIVTLPQSRAMGFGVRFSDLERRAWIERTVALFLNGFEHWGASPG